MKKLLLSFSAALLLSNSNAAEFTGKAADKLYKGTSFIRLADNTTIPDYIRFDENSQPEINMLESWLKTNAGLNVSDVKLLLQSVVMSDVRHPLLKISIDANA